MRSADDRKHDGLRKVPWVQDLMEDKGLLAAYLATCKYDWQTSDESDACGKRMKE